MPLEDTDVLDGVSNEGAGGPTLVVVDTREWADDRERWACLLGKLKSYVGYIHGEDFAAKYPGVRPGEVSIEVRCVQPPTDLMRGLTSFAPRGDESNRIAVSYAPLA